MQYSQTQLTRTLRALESVRINGVSVLSELNLVKMQGLSFPRDKANRKAGFDCTKE